MAYVMIEIRVQQDLQQLRVDRTPLTPVVWVPHDSSWSELEAELSQHLSDHEIDLARKIWCQDDFPRTFETGDGFVVIRPAVR